MLCGEQMLFTNGFNTYLDYHNYDGSIRTRINTRVYNYFR